MCSSTRCIGFNHVITLETLVCQDAIRFLPHPRIATPRCLMHSFLYCTINTIARVINSQWSLVQQRNGRLLVPHCTSGFALAFSQNKTSIMPSIVEPPYNPFNDPVDQVEVYEIMSTFVQNSGSARDLLGNGTVRTYGFVRTYSTVLSCMLKLWLLWFDRFDHN